MPIKQAALTKCITVCRLHMWYRKVCFSMLQTMNLNGRGCFVPPCIASVSVHKYPAWKTYVSWNVIVWVMSPPDRWSCVSWPRPASSIDKLDLYLAVSTFISSETGSWVLTTKSGKNTIYKSQVSVRTRENWSQTRYKKNNRFTGRVLTMVSGDTSSQRGSVNFNLL